MTISRPGHREAAVIAGGGAATLVEGDIRDTERVRGDTSKSMRSNAVMHFAAWLSVGESVRNPAGYYHNNVIGALSVLEAMVAQRRETTRVLLDVRGVRQSRCRRRSPKIIPAARSTPTAKPSWPSNGRCRTTSAPTDIRSIALRYFNAAGADPDGELGEDHDPEIHVIPRAIDAACGSDHLPDLRRGLRDARRHLSARLRARRRSVSGAPAGTRGARPRSVVHRLQPRERPADFGPRQFCSRSNE